MTIIASPSPAATAPAHALPSVGAVLRRAADTLDGLPHARVTPTDMHLALRDAATFDYHRAVDALEAFGSYLLAATGDDRWPYGWSPRSRAEVAAQMRAAAAECSKTPASVTA